MLLVRYFSKFNDENIKMIHESQGNQGKRTSTVSTLILIDIWFTENNRSDLSNQCKTRVYWKTSCFSSLVFQYTNYLWKLSRFLVLFFWWYIFILHYYLQYILLLLFYFYYYFTNRKALFILKLYWANCKLF